MKIPKVLDNKKYRVVDELREELKKGSKLSVISAGLFSKRRLNSNIHDNEGY